jgi:hypothetical protein
VREKDIRTRIRSLRQQDTEKKRYHDEDNVSYSGGIRYGKGKIKNQSKDKIENQSKRSQEDEGNGYRKGHETQGMEGASVVRQERYPQETAVRRC